ncbi:hypothetical protein BCR35DRAFT_331838 [Leucosporidium creatinivorum]|uniref:Protein CPL1-like domain-containing protein n=1 Tax=Leucosporidium creatinivorum TaxID=106004 RepID=A0A1Y2FA47_9BASI|nr:hypothetical protein BCR35DRAFT_331838 [Leucosporidium creatinivorum]
MQLHDPPMCSFIIPSSLGLGYSHGGEEEGGSLVLPEGTEACSSGIGGFECVDTLTDVNECGGCHNFGGVSCSTIEGALATSCRDGGCVVHACTGGFTLRDDGSGCDEDDE